jgi:UPF0716 protein FxsA
VVIQVADAIGLLPTLALLVLDAMIGTALMRSQSRAVWRAARQTLRSGGVPAREVLDGALIIAGGALLIAPGFITDLLGALLLIPATRAPIRRLVVARFTRRMGAVAMPFPRDEPAGRRTWPQADYDADADARAVELDPRELDR